VPEVYIDSNIFFYAKIMDGVFGKPCSKVIRKIADRNLEASISALVPLEVGNALRKYGLGAKAAEEVRGIFSLGMKVYSIDAVDAQEAMEVFEALGVNPYDCLHSVLMRKNGVRQIVSVDKEFDKIEWLERIDPESA